MLDPDAAVSGDANTGLDGGLANDGDAGSAGSCTAGEILRPVRVVNATPWRPDNACNIDDALAEDGVVAGLDALEAGTCSSMSWGANEPCACLAVDLGAVYDIERWVVRAGRIENACGRACLPEVCDSADTMGIGWGTDEASYWDNPTTVRLESGPLRDYEVSVNGPARWLVACRVEWGFNRNDVGVDAVSAVCDQ